MVLLPDDPEESVIAKLLGICSSREAVKECCERANRIMESPLPCEWGIDEDARKGKGKLRSGLQVNKRV